MRLAILNINQAVAQEKGLDITDLLILDWFQSFSASGQMEKKITDNDVYYWCSYQKIVDDLPILNIAARGVAVHIKKLIDKHILEGVTEQTKHGKRIYIRLMGGAYSALYETEKAMSKEDDMEDKAMSKQIDMGNEKEVAKSNEIDMPMSKQIDMLLYPSLTERSITDNLLGITSCSEVKNDLQTDSTQSEKVFIQIELNPKGTVYDVTFEELEQMRQYYPAVDIEQSYRNIAAWSHSNPKQRKTLKGVKRFINSWLCGDQDKASKRIKASAKTSSASFEGEKSGSVKL